MQRLEFTQFFYTLPATNFAQRMKRLRRGLYLRGRTWWLYWRHEGHTHRVSLDTADEIEAAQRADAILMNPVLVEAGEIKREVEAWLAARAAAGRFSAQTVAERRRVLRKMLRDLSLTAVRQLSTPLLQAWYDRRLAERAPSTADSQLAIAQAFCEWLCGEKKLRENPARAVVRRRHGVQRRELFADRETVARLIDRAPSEALRFILLAGFEAGLRRREIGEVRWEWFDAEATRITVAPASDKNRRGRTIPLTPRFSAWVKTHRPAEASGYVLAPEKEAPGKWRYRYDFRRPFADYMLAQGVPWISPHVMRHTFGSLRASAGRSIYKIAVWLGDSVKTTERHYAKLLPIDPEIAI